MTRRRNGGSRPRSRRECRSLIAVESSPRIVQQTQPDCSITIVSSMRSSRSWSRPMSPNSLINTAVSDRAGSSSSRCSSVVLPEPRQPVINVTGVKSGGLSAKLALHEGDKLLIERIAGPAEEPLGGHPQMHEVVDDLSLAGCGRQDERAALPVGEVHPIVFDNPISRRYAIHPLTAARRRIGVTRENAGSGNCVGPVLRRAENAAQCA